MAKRPYQHELNNPWEINEDHQAHQVHGSKIPATTRYTQPQNTFNLTNSFVLGKNDLLENNTSSELDSSDAESDVSFQERLHCCHEKHLLNEIYKFLQLKGTLKPQNSFDIQSNSKSTQSIKDIEERVFDEIKRSHGNNEVEKIKITLKFIKRNENLTKIYFEVVKYVPQTFQTAVFLLLKLSVMVYLEGKQWIGGQQSYMSESIIKKYLGKNFEKISQELMRDENLQSLFNAEKEQMLRMKFSQFLYQWVEGFFMAKEGYPCLGYKETQKNPNARISLMQGTIQNEKRKKIKKF